MKLPKISISILIFLLLFIFLGDIFYITSPYLLNKDIILISPSYEHLFGTDRLGRDILARVIEGAKVSILIGLGSATISSLIGLIVGVTAGFFKGLIDKSITILIDLFLTFPTFFLLLALVSYIDASIFVLIIVISITGWMTTSRMIRSEVFSISNKPFIKILKTGKVNHLKIIFKYFTPLIAPIFFISFVFGLSGAILVESSLSFLGLGITPPQMSLGSLISEGKEIIDIAWWVSFFPGVIIFILTFTLINISDYLQTLTNQR